MQQNNTTATAVDKQFVVRIFNNAPVIFDCLSKAHGQLKAVIGNREETVGLDFYAQCVPMDDEYAKEVVKTYANKNHIPFESIQVRHRMPSAEHVQLAEKRRSRRLNDANLKLVSNAPKRFEQKQETKVEQESSQDYRSKNEREGKVDEFQNTVQHLHDAHKHPVKEEDKQTEQKVTTNKQEGAAMPSKRKYTRRTTKAVSSKRSAAALKKWQKELEKAVEESPSEMLKPVEVQASPDVSKQEISDADLALALRIVKMLKGLN